MAADLLVPPSIIDETYIGLPICQHAVDGNEPSAVDLGLRIPGGRQVLVTPDQRSAVRHFLNTFFRTFRPSFCRSGLNSFNKLFCSWPSMPKVKSSKKPEADRGRWCQAGAIRAALVMAAKRA